jgi:hypothetical protein
MQKKRREISPALNATVDEYVSMCPPLIQGIISRIRVEKKAGMRFRPSTSLIDKSLMLTPGKRIALLDKVAELVDENVVGRSDMCLQYATLINLALRHLGFSSHAVAGTATYLSDKGKRVFSWRHGWVRVGKEVIDGNTDSLSENIMVPKSLTAPPYWGSVVEISTRKYDQDGYIEDDPDVTNTWWPELKNWLDADFTKVD